MAMNVGIQNVGNLFVYNQTVVLLFLCNFDNLAGTVKP